MDNQIHISEALDLLKDLMKRNDSLSCHPKNKILIYRNFALSKLYFHLAIADLSKTGAAQSLDSIVTRYVSVISADTQC